MSVTLDALAYSCIIAQTKQEHKNLTMLTENEQNV